MQHASNWLFNKLLFIFVYANTRNKGPDNKIQLVKEFLKELGVTVKVKKEKNTPNADTIAAVDELKAGKGKSFKNIEELFSSI